jgi:hypothetical protein
MDKKLTLKEKENNKKIIVDRILHNLKTIMKEAQSLRPNDPNFYRAIKRVNFACQFEPLLVVNRLGKYLYKYKHFVYDENSDNAILDWEFSETSTISNPEVADITILVIAQLKICARELDENGRKFFRKLMIELLDDYIEFSCGDVD